MNLQLENKILNKTIQLILHSMQDSNCKITDSHLQHIYNICYCRAVQIIQKD